MKGNGKRTRFAICISDDLAGLELGKVYRILPDAKAAEINWQRVVDDSEEDYLFPASAFVFIELPLRARRVIGTSSAIPITREPARAARSRAKKTNARSTVTYRSPRISSRSVFQRGR